MSEEEKPARTWWIHVDLTVVIIVGSLLLVAIIAKWQFDASKRREIEDADRVRIEREAKDKEWEAKAEERSKQQRELDVEKQKQFLEIERQRQADRELTKKQRDKKDQERAARDQELLRVRKEEVAVGWKLAEQQAAVERANGTIGRPPGQPRPPVVPQPGSVVAPPVDAAKTREQEIATLRQQYAQAVKDLDELPPKVDALQTKIIAFKNKVDYATKKGETARRDLENVTDAAAAREKARAGSLGGASSASLANEAAAAAAKHDAIAREHQINADGLARAQTEKDALLLRIAGLKQDRDNAIARLKELGAEIATAPPVAAPKPAEPAAVPKKTFLLKDGQKVVAVKAIDGGDVWSLKTAAGKIITVEKAQVEKVTEEE